MKLYRLKKEAVPFFKESIATHVVSKETWDLYNVCESALEEVGEPYVTFGHESKLDSGTKYSSTAGWSSKDGKYFHFTIHYPDVKLCESDKFSNGKLTRELMDRIQSSVTNFYQQFTNV